MKLKEFINMFVGDIESSEDCPNCEIVNDGENWNSETIQFKGTINKIPKNLLENKLLKWDLIGNYIVFVI